MAHLPTRPAAVPSAPWLTLTLILPLTLTLTLTLAYPLPGRAVLVYYDLEALGGDLYRYTYTVSNDGPPLAGALSAFQIAFPDATGLVAVSPGAITAAWDELTFEPVLGDPAAYDVVARGAGILPGESVAGFAVQFTWPGASPPQAQAFQVYDPDTYAVLAQGTAALAPAGGVPVPAPLGLLALGLGGLVWRSGRQNRREVRP